MIYERVCQRGVRGCLRLLSMHKLEVKLGLAEWDILECIIANEAVGVWIFMIGGADAIMQG